MIFINLLQVCRAVIGIEDGKPICVLVLSNGDREQFIGSGMTHVLARLTELGIALNGQPLAPVVENSGSTDDTPPSA
jgi:hypothetical protein